MIADNSLQELQEQIEALEANYEEAIQDVRERVVQVKRETDAKAPGNHTHEELESRLAEMESVRSDLEAFEDEIASLRTTIDQTNSRLEGGFENFEEILESILDRTSDLEGDMEALRRTVRSLRETLDTVAERELRRSRADQLKTSAANQAVRKAKCESCRATIDIALLSEATCPNCKESFTSLDGNPGFFGTSVLETGERPALEGAVGLSSIGVEPAEDERTQSDQSDTPFNWQSVDKDGES